MLSIGYHAGTGPEGGVRVPQLRSHPELVSQRAVRQPGDWLHQPHGRPQGRGHSYTRQ